MKYPNLRILYAIQGTGNGHLARATEIVPLLKKLGQTDVLVSGIQGDIKLPFPVKFKLYGLSFIFGKHGGVSLWQTIRRSKPIRFLHDMRHLPVNDYDVVICDFEPVTAWACRLRKKYCVGLSHQNAVLHPASPKPTYTDPLGLTILKNYAPSSVKYGFHFKALDDKNFTPVIRSGIRQTEARNLGHYTVYLPAFSNEEIEAVLRTFPQYRWEVFSKHSAKDYRAGSVWFRPVSLDQFSQSFADCTGILCTAGFETPAEAIYMGKKVCVIPMKKQYEQACNAAFAASLGIRVLSGWQNARNELADWLEKDKPFHMEYPNDTFRILEQVVDNAIMAQKNRSN
ncbi:MAG: glycosyltransferase family protein [Mangrovibacterium sp.]